MMYQRGSFQVPVSNGTAAMCDEKGHSAADARGNCLCCGRPVDRPTVGTLTVLHPTLIQYAELSGGPEDGEIINLSRFAFIDDEIIVAGHRYVAENVEKGLLRMSYAGPAAE